MWDLLWLSFASVAYAACYFPSGRLATNDSPCRDDTDNAVCCGQGYACLSNGLCQATGEELQRPGATEFVRGGCTDKSFRSSSCPLICIDPDLDNVGGGHGLGKCEGDQDMYYCINSNLDEVNCTSGDGILFFAGTPSVITTIGLSESTSIEVQTSVAEPESTESTESTTTSAETTTQQRSRESETEPATADESKENAVNKGAIIGGAVGGFLVLLMLLLLGWWLLRKRRARNYDPQQSSIGYTYSPAVPGKPGHDSVYEVPGAPVSWKGAQHTSIYEERYLPPPPPQEMPAAHNEIRSW